MERPVVIRSGELGEGQSTPGIERLTAFARPGIWFGRAHTDPGVVSGWHHHGEHDTFAFVVEGAFRLESGPDGRDVVEAGPGDFVVIPARCVHRESNPSEQRSILVLVRVGEGEPVINVEGPPAAGT